MVVASTRLHRKIKCPRHYMLKPGGVPFVMEKIPSLRNVDEKNAQKFNQMLRERGAAPVKMYRPKVNKYGQKIQNFKDYYQPDVSAAEVAMRVYNPLHPICIKCKRCITA